MSWDQIIPFLTGSVFTAGIAWGLNRATVKTLCHDMDLLKITLRLVELDVARIKALLEASERSERRG